MTIIKTVTNDDPAFSVASAIRRMTVSDSPVNKKAYHDYFHGSYFITDRYGSIQDNTTYWQERNLFNSSGVENAFCSLNVVSKSVTLAGNDIYQRLYNRSYNRFKDKSKSLPIELGLNLAELGSTADMMIKRLATLTKALSALKSGNLLVFLQTLGLVDYKTYKGRATIRRPSSEDMASIWLEYWLGWAPLCSDILTAVGRLGTPPKEFEIRTGASVPWSTRSHVSTSGSSYRYETVQRYRAKVRISGDVTVADPEAYESWNNGLNNLAVVTWGAVPVSFLADWFANIETLLGSATDFAGLKFAGCSVSHVAEYESQHDWPLFNGPAGAKGRKKNAMVYGRKLVIAPPAPQLVIELPNPSVTRALTSLSLFRNVVLKNSFGY
jgi:hypothetical protein